jgi:uncharacterized membrane protein YfcA
MVNSVAGGGSLLIYPLLLGFGIMPIAANATTSVIVWPGTISSAYGYKKYLKKLPRHYFLILIPCLVGGLIGAIVLKNTSNSFFRQIVPWFFLIAVVLIAIQPKLHKWLYEREENKKTQNYDHIFVLIVSFILLVIAAIYGGYFGAGFGIIMLGILGLTKISNINEMNGLKNISSACINLTAIIYFTLNGLINWGILPVLLIGNVLGGYVGARYSDRLPSKHLRGAIIIIGLAIAITLFVKPNL